MVDRVGDQVAHDALDPADVGLGQARVVGGADHDPHVALLGERAGRLDDPAGDVDEVDVVELEDGRARVEAADLQQVGEQGLEPVELGLQQLRGPGGGGVELVAGVVQHVAGHPHRRERRPQLVGDVGDEPALHPAELLQLADLALQARGHLVERRRQASKVVLAGDPQPLVSRPAASRSATRRASRTGVTTCG